MNRIKVKSKNIKSIGYDEEKEILEIEFMKGEIYHYLDVDVVTFNDLMTADSHGRYFYSKIKGVKKYERKS